MQKSSSSSCIKNLIFLAGLLVGGLIIQLLISFLIFLPYGGIGALEQIRTHPESHVAALKALQIIQAICLFILPALAYAKIKSDKPTHYLRLNKGIIWKTGLIIALATVAIIPLINLMGELNARINLPEFLSAIEAKMQDMEQNAARVTLLLTSGSGLGALCINLLMIAVLPAIGEELFFRGVIQRILSESLRNKHVAIWITAIIFSAFHLQFYGFIPRTFLGLAMGYLFVYSGSIWLPILAHFINNGTATVYYYLHNNAYVTEDTLNNVGTGESWNMGVFSAGILLLIIFYLERQKTELHLNESI